MRFATKMALLFAGGLMVLVAVLTGLWAFFGSFANHFFPIFPD